VSANERELSMKVFIAVSRFNEGVTRKLLDGAMEQLSIRGIDEKSIDVIWVPGAFELVVAVSRALSTKKYGAAVAIGAVVRGETPHFDFISNETTRGLGEVARETKIPVGFGLLTCDTMEQALARAGGAMGNKGAEAAQAACETAEALNGLLDDA